MIARQSRLLLAFVLLASVATGRDARAGAGRQQAEPMERRRDKLQARGGVLLAKPPTPTESSLAPGP